MSNRLGLTYDAELVDVVASQFGLRESNAQALHALVEHLAGGFDPSKVQIMHMATGSGKTYVMAAFIEYARQQGKRNVVIITPGLIVQAKTVMNFTPGAHKFIGNYTPGTEPSVFTPQTLHQWGAKQASNQMFNSVNLFIFNIDQILRPTDTEGSTSTTGGLGEQQRGVRRFSEAWGNVMEYLQEVDDLIVITDEAHSYTASAERRQEAISDLDATVVIGLTATSDPSDPDTQIVHKYPLYRAIQDGHVKRPVIAFRKGGYKTDKGTHNDELQLRDAKMLLNRKTDAYQRYITDHDGARPVNPVLFVVCKDTADAKNIEGYLAGPEMFGDSSRVLRVDNKTKKEAGVIEALNDLDTPGSPVRAVVSVNMLKEGWDVKNIAVICSLRASASEVLTQQTMGRGLRLPFGTLTGVKDVDQLDILSHEAFEKMLNDEGIRAAFDLAEVVSVVDKKPKNTESTDDRNAGGAGTDTTSPGTGTGAADKDGGRGSGTSSGTEHDAGSGTGTGTESGAEPDAGDPTIGVTEFDEDDYSDDEKRRGPKVVEPVTITMNEQFKDVTFLFPTSVFDIDQVSFSPARIEDRVVEDAAANIVKTGATIQRKQIDVAGDGTRLSTTSTRDAEGYTEEIAVDQVIEMLTKSVMAAQLMARTTQLTAITRSKVVKFVRAGQQRGVRWTQASVDHAAGLLRSVFRTAASAQANEAIRTRRVVPKALPISTEIVIADKDSVRQRWDEFVARAPVQGYELGLFPVAKFDARDTEFQIADMLERSNQVTWWKRLYDTDAATIAWGRGQKYYPDFVVCEGDHYWIVEGKGADKIDDEDVRLKAQAARETVSLAAGEPLMLDQQWHYLLVTADDVANADTWEALKGYENAH